MDFAPEFDTTISLENRLKLLEQARQDFIALDNALGKNERLKLSDQDACLLSLYTSDENAKIRAVAVDILSQYGPVTWEDAERWLSDADSDVRGEAFSAIGLGWAALSDLCTSDLPRCAALFEASAELRDEVSVQSSLMCHGDEEWLDLMWSMLGRLLDLGRCKLNSNLICGPLEDILVHKWVTVDDPRLQAWLKGDSLERKMALLSVVQWFGMKEPWQRKIAEALAKDRNGIVSGTAKGLLAGRRVQDIQCRPWADGPDVRDGKCNRKRTDS